MDCRFGLVSSKSLYSTIYTSKQLDTNKFKSKAIACNLQKEKNDFNHLINLLSELQIKVIKKNNTIKKIVEKIELNFANGNNDTNLLFCLYSSKIFLEIINAFNICLPEYQEQLLCLIESILQNKNIVKYISKNNDFLPFFMKFLTSDKLYDSTQKICENILMNSQGVFPINQLEELIKKIYSYMNQQDKLDRFSRILAILIFDYKKIEIKQIFKEKETLRTYSFIKPNLENQFIFINLPNFIGNLVKKLSNRLLITQKMASDINMNNSILEFRIYGINNGLIEDNLIETNINTMPIINNVNLYEDEINVSNNIISLDKIDFSKKELLSLIQLNIFSDFIPDFTKTNNKDNIYNTYIKITKIISEMRNNNKILADRQYFVTMEKLTTYQIEMLFVLSSLLGCKRKTEIQDILAKKNIINILDNYLEYIEWGNIFCGNLRPSFTEQRMNVNDESAYHGEGCCCDRDTALKVQFLRLVYSFCCRDDNNIKNKCLLLSAFDIEKLFWDNKYLNLIYLFLKGKYKLYKNSIFAKLNNDFKKLFNKLYILENNGNSNIFQMDNLEEKNKYIQNILNDMVSLDNLQSTINKYNDNFEVFGLFHKLIFKYIQECYYSSAKFWLSSNIEVILRGNNTFFQLFVAKSGLLPCLLYDILYSKPDQKQILQLSFDMLGEILKFNRACFYLFDYYFNDEKEFNEFCKKILSKETLVDSNVFLRSVILSNYFFTIDDLNNKRKFFIEKCKICSFIKNKIHTVFISLITIVLPNKINQTNISCINSSLLILIIEYLKGNLEKFLHEVRLIFGEKAKEAIENLKNLAILWNKFYNYRPKDYESLQYSTTISFNIWKKVVNILLDKDENNKMSLYYEDY